jgi:quercetin dioxygenase-like cupin family protein
MEITTINRPYEAISKEEHNISWSLLTRNKSTYKNLTISVQRFDPGGFFSDHTHDLEQFFYVTHGRFEFTVNGETMNVEEGDLIFVGRNAHHSGKNLAASPSELLFFDYFPPDSQSNLGLD